MKNSWFRRGTFVALCLVASGALGNAFSGSNPAPGSLRFDGFSDGSVSATTNFGTFSAGQFQGYFDPTSEGDLAGFEADDFFRFFCVDLTDTAISGASPYTRNLGLDGSHTALDAAQLTRLFNQFYPNGATGTYYNAGITNFGDFATAQDSAAFQLAVWEIWFDNDMNLSTGTFTASSAAAAQAQGYLNAVGFGATPAAGWTLYEFNSTGSPLSQNYISVQHSGTLQQAPEPGTLILLGAGALAAWGTSKRNRKTA
jgi:PEP-CTERM motif-containing protein